MKTLKCSDCEYVARGNTDAEAQNALQQHRGSMHQPAPSPTPSVNKS